MKEKESKLRISLPDDILSSTTSTNMLAMTFRQVVVQELWNFELAIFVPGSRRNMEDLGKLREVKLCPFVSFNLLSQHLRFHVVIPHNCFVLQVPHGVLIASVL